MSASNEIVVVAITYLLFKHMIGDFFLQKPYQFLNKGVYGHPGGILHSAIHCVLSIPVFAILPASSVAVAASIIGAEFLIHYHLDWGKEKIITKFDWTTNTQGFWSATGVDQLLHGLTYIAMVWVLL